VSKTLTIFVQEVKNYFLSPIAYIIAAGFVVFSGVSFYYRATNFPRTIAAAQSSGLLDMLKQNRINYFVITPMLSDVGYILMFLIPVITMRLWAEERRAHTDELLLTSPIGVGKIMLGKYLGGVLFVLALLCITLVYVAFLFHYSAPDPGVTISSYLALVLFIAAAVGIGLFTSTVTENQIVASVSCLIIELIFATFGGVAQSVKSVTLGKVLAYVSWREHMVNFFDGVIRSSDLLFFAGMIFLWVFLAYQSVESLRWR